MRNSLITPALILGLSLLAQPAMAHKDKEDNDTVMRDHIDGIATVVDVNTLRVGRHKVDLLGVTPPSNEAEGAKATAFARHLVDGQMVSCKLTGKTPSGRKIGSCYIGDLDISAAIINAGYSHN